MLTRSLTPADIAAQALRDMGGPQLVYVREVSADEVLAQAPAEALEAFAVQPGQTLYAVHRADGERLAVMADRETAFAAALAHEFAPVSVH